MIIQNPPIVGFENKTQRKKKAKTVSATEIIRTSKLFEFYVKKCWPIHRLFAKNKYAKRCKNCAASEKMISLNHKNICEKCLVYQPDQNVKNKKNELELNQILSDYQGKGKNNYDALVLYSGGKDSTYLIRRIQTEFPKLRLLAYTLDNGFMSPIAKQNINDLLPQLGVDHVFVKPHENFYKNLFRYTITHLNAEGGYGTVDFSDGEFMLDTARKIAAEKKIPLLLCGYSKYQVQNGLHLNHFESPREKEISDRTETANLKLSDIFQEKSDRDLWWHGSKYNPHDVARLIFPLYAWDIEEDEIKSKVKEWGLMNKKNQSPIVTNHLLIPLIGVVDVHQLGYSSFEMEFSRMIREGKADRREWQPIFEFLEYTAKTGLFLKPTVVQLLEQLNLNLTDVGVKFK
jgi:tRNA(Ile)-lysidine synthase TilS/MesJ